LRVRLRLRQKWREFRSRPPGRRFQEGFARRQRTRKSAPAYKRWLRVGLAICLLLIGVVLTFIPGPAILFFVLGAGILSEQWLGLARALDWLEMKGRKAYQGVKRWWKRASGPVRGGIVGACCASLAAVGYLAYYLLLSN
jgi:hypothetical protein